MPHTHHNIQEIAVTLRQTVIEMLVEAGSGHTAGALGTAEIFATLYWEILNIDPKNPADPDRDRFILSNGHICPIWYAALAHRGFFDKKLLWKLRKIDGTLQGHPVKGTVPGIESSSGSLGQGLGIAAGMAYSALMDNRPNRVYVVTGDGELQEGNIWESAMFAPAKNLYNLTWIIDRNNIQIDGHTEQVMPLENLKDKLEGFNWFVAEIDGHNVTEVINACNMAKTVTQRPTAIIAHTIPGYGVDFMEYKVDWHGKPPTREQAQEALKQLRSLKGKINYD